MPMAEPSSLVCWCCADAFTEVDLVRLGARPEVSICLDCARFLHRRAMARRRTPLGALRAWVQRVRDGVIQRGWHRRGRLGAILRGVDRFLP